MSGCDCQIEPGDSDQRSVLLILLVINGIMFAAEMVTGLLADSTGLLADSLDMLADALVYSIALYAVGRGHSTKIAAARWSGIFQISLACGLFLDIVRRTIFGSEPESWLMSGMGLVALAANITCLAILSKHREGGVHMRASWIFSKNDVIANLGVILAGVLIHFSGGRWPDLVIGILITSIVFRGGIQILGEASKAAMNQPTDSETAR